jgi:hypothetical protein
MPTDGFGESRSRGFPDDDEQEHNRHDRRVEIWHGPIGAFEGIAGSLRCNVFYEVPLIAQPNKLSCWAAAVAMLVSYRRGSSLSPEEVYRQTGRDINSTLAISWDEEVDHLQSIFGLRSVPEATTRGGLFTPANWCSWLSRYGPLYVTVSGAPSHAVIVRGLVSTDLFHQVHILDPWNTSVTFDADPIVFNPPNRGFRGRALFDNFLDHFHGVDLHDEGARYRVMYIP